MRKKKEKYDSCVVGTIVELKSRGMDYPTRITVEYVVDGKVYNVRETLKLTSSAIKTDGFPIGQKKTPAMGDARVGAKAEVLYRSEKPSDALIRDNRGTVSV